MDTLVYFIPQTDAFPQGTVRDIEYGGKIIRIIYFAEDMGFLPFRRFRRKIKDKTKNAVMFKSAIADKFKNEKIYRDGRALVSAHIKDIALTLSSKDLVIFSSDARDLETLGEVLSQTKSVKILTLPSLLEEFEDYLLENYGIAGAVSAAAGVRGKNVLIMPGTDMFSASGADKVIDMNSENLEVYFKPPKELKAASTFFKSPDVLETALDFLGIDYLKARLAGISNCT